MRTANVLFKEESAGVLSQSDDGRFHFSYHPHWVSDPSKPSISLTLPKSQGVFESDTLFPFFYHLLPEGVNKRMICQTFKIDEEDAFGILLQASKVDTVGAVTIERV